MSTRDDPQPAIVRPYTLGEDDVPVINTPYDRVSNQPGFGESGYSIEIVEHDCPNEQCNFDRMIRRHDIPDNSVRYWCLSPNCPHYVTDKFDYACHGANFRGRATPVITKEIEPPQY